MCNEYFENEDVNSEGISDQSPSPGQDNTTAASGENQTALDAPVTPADVPLETEPAQTYQEVDAFTQDAGEYAPSPEPPVYQPPQYTPSPESPVYQSPQHTPPAANPYGYGYGYNPYAYTQPGMQPPPRKKKNRTGLIAALFLAVTLFAGGFGGVAGYYISQNQPPIEDQQGGNPSAAPSEASPSAEVPAVDDNRNKPTIETALPDGVMSVQDVFEQGNLSTVAIFTTVESKNVFNQTESQSAAGSGFIITPDGYIITNYHVIENAQTIKVTLYDGTTYNAVLIGGDQKNDLAVIKIEATGLTPVSIGDSDELRVGDTVMAIGNPLGELQNSLTVGYLSAKERAVTIDKTTCVMMQADVAVSPGNSGGPLFNLSGQVVGIVSAKSVSTDVEGISFAIPINHAVKIVNELIQTGAITGQAYFGISCADSSQITDQDLPAGAYVQVVEEDGPAKAAGLLEGDVITAINGNKITNVVDLLAQKNKYKAGDAVELTVVRDGKEMKISLTFGETPEEEPEEEAQETPREDQNNGGQEWPWGQLPDDFWNNN